MNLSRSSALALLLMCAAAAPAFAAADFFWNCTTPDGIKYADASKCDKGDTAVKVSKTQSSAPTASSALVRSAAQDEGERPVGMHTGACPTNPAYCTLPNYGVTEGTPRAQAIQQFMRTRECDFMQRFPQRCTKPN